MKDIFDDDFWDLTLHVERKKENREQSVQQAPKKLADDNILSEIQDRFNAPQRENAYTASSISAAPSAQPSDQYVPQSKMFVIDVKLSRSAAKSASDFEKRIKAFRAMKGNEAPFAEFYSSLPVYQNLSPQACKYYLWWRDSFACGTALLTSWSYISLYLSELINCDDTDSCENVKIMWKLFETYSDKSSGLYVSDVEYKLPEIICDYSLIHNIGIPADVSEKAICDAARSSRFKEFFFDREHPASAMALLATLCSEYDYDKSKFASQVTVSNARSYIYGAIKFSIDKAVAEKIEHPFAGDFREKTTITRFSYSNFIFMLPKYTYVIKVDFCSANRSYILRNTVTGIIKQCENRLRVHSGIKAKLRVFLLEPFFRDAVDEYLDMALPKVRILKPEKKKPEPEYERLYERESTEFSIDNAKKIEERSWNVTEKLIEGMDGYEQTAAEKIIPDNSRVEESCGDFEAKDYIEPPECDKDSQNTAFGSEIAEIISLVPDMKDFLVAVHLKDYSVMMREVDRIGIPVSLIVDRINEAAFDVIGDTLIEELGEGYQIISDYTQLFDSPEE